MEDKNVYWAFVKARYPHARFLWWYKFGELHFYPSKGAEERDRPMACFREGRNLVIKENY